MWVVQQIVPLSTYRRRKKLTLAESVQTARLARVIATAVYVWNDEEDARRFLASPHPMMGMKTPVELCRTDPGTRWVEDILWDLFYGIAGAGVKPKKAATKKDVLLRYEQLLKLSMKAIKNKETAKAWFSRPNPAMKGKTPMECSRTAAGAREVEQILADLEVGVFD